MMIGFLSPIDPQSFRHLQQGVRTDDVGVDEGVRAGNRSVHMALCSKMNHGVYTMLLHQFFKQHFVADGALDEIKPIGIPDRRQIRFIAGVGECIEYHDRVSRVGFAPVMHEVSTDETGGAGD